MDQTQGSHHIFMDPRRLMRFTTKRRPHKPLRVELLPPLSSLHSKVHSCGCHHELQQPKALRLRPPGGLAI
eukprot:1161392-Pelagomonas_calceolata.AAC.28